MREQVLREVKKKAKDYEVFLQNTEVNEINIQKNRINFVDKTFDGGFGVRILTNGLGFSSSNDKSSERIKKVVSDVLKSSSISQRIKFQFPSKKPFEKTKNVDKRIRDNGEEVVREYAEQILNSLPEGVLLSFGKVRTYDSNIQIINSEGLDVEREETSFMTELSLILEKGGKKVEFWPHEYRRKIEDLPVSRIQEWIKFARDQFIAKEPKTEKTTLVFSPSTVLDGLGMVVGTHATGSAKLNGISKFSPEEKVASPRLTILSDGLYPFGLMTSGFDDEGIPQRRIPLIDKGVFKNFLYDQFYGLKDGVGSTGNGLRQSSSFFVFNAKFATLPANQVSNFYVKPGRKSFDELIEEIDHGILVEQFSWLIPDEITGKFSSEIRTGYYIDRGEITQPIKGGLVAGDLFNMMKNVSGVSNESVITSGGSVLAGVCPYIRFEGVQVAGSS